MHNWFFISLIAPILWTIVTHIDKYILSKHFKSNGIGGIFLFSALFSVAVVFYILLFTNAAIFHSSFEDVFDLLFVGILSASAFYLYLRALEIEESSVVVPLLQMIPIFGYFLSYFILGEVLTQQQLLAALIIIIGIIILSLEFDEENKLKLKRKVLILIGGSSLLFALHDIIFKAIALEDSFATSIFWQYAGLTIVGLFVFIFSPLYRQQFLYIFKRNSGQTLALNIWSEVLYIAGNLANNFATLLAPVALVLVVTSYQPLFVFIGGTLLTLFLPKIATEKISTKHLFQKILSIAIILIGSYLLYSASGL